MRQLLQDARTGEVTVAEVPAPKLLAGCVLVRTAASLVSAGTERASSEFARKNLLQKARMRPDLVRDVLSKISRDGLIATVGAVRGRLDQPSVLGYSSAGTVVGVGEGVADIQAGDRVACAGVNYAVHAEFACVPRLLVARIPSDRVSFEEAAFTTVGSVAVHGVRTADVRLGDVVAVIGLGLLGQLTVQILKAAGCCVLGMDISLERAALASRLGADAVSHLPAAFRDLCIQHSGGCGVDAVLITAQTASNDPVNLAGEVARDRAVIVAVGAVGMDIPRRSFYEKELDFRVSRSCGPGRYDSTYEHKGIDYPIGYVRWTETRNMAAFLRLLADGKLNLNSLVTHRFPIERGQSAYDLITGQTGEAFLGVLIAYRDHAEQNHITKVEAAGAPVVSQEQIRIGLLGAGSFATSTLLPAINRAGGVEMITACAANGPHARYAARKFGFRSCATDEREVCSNPSINTVVIATRHHLHARQVIAALKSGKHVFCEKPLCLNEDELLEISATRDAEAVRRPVLMVGFNRRFAALSLWLKDFLTDVGEPLAIHYRVNAGFLPADHWLNDLEQGGGRIVGEVCHFVDFLSFLTGAVPVEAQTRCLPSPGQYSNDNVVCWLRFSDGSQGTITYLANGDKSYSKERLEVFGGGSVAVLEDFRRLELIRQGKKSVFRSRWRQDKGHRGEWEAFIRAVQTGAEEPIPFREVVSTMLATFALEESRCLGQTVVVKPLPGNHRTPAGNNFGRAS
jgi:predicted dehydrogenase/threonine dehydrogenase-like Zn-dependent dehydrogenase